MCGADLEVFTVAGDGQAVQPVPETADVWRTMDPAVAGQLVAPVAPATELVDLRGRPVAPGHDEKRGGPSAPAFEPADDVAHLGQRLWHDVMDAY